MPTVSIKDEGASRPDASYEELSLYVIAGWHDDGSGDLSVAHLLQPKTLDLSTTTIGLFHRNGERVAIVASHRADRWTFSEARNFAADYAQRLGIPKEGGGEVPSGPTPLAQAVSVAGSRIFFEVASSDDHWWAVGQGPRSFITVASYKVPPDGISLVHPDVTPPSPVGA
jgi:hypothetical protein